MEKQEFEYILHVWDEKPEDLSEPPYGHWSAHITDAYAIPEIGEAIVSAGGLDNYCRFRVFDVRHNIGSCLSNLITSGRSKLKGAKTPEGKDGLVLVLAYDES